MSDKQNESRKVTDKLVKLKSEIETATPYLASDEHASTLREAADTRMMTKMDTINKTSINTTTVKPWVHFVAGGLGGDVYKVEGARALFKGLGPSLVGVIPARSINFFTYGYSKDIFKREFFNGEESSVLHLMAGITAGIVTSTATNPIWLIKTRLQLDKANVKEYSGSIDCIRKTVAREGFLSLYKGLSASYLGSIESTIQWILYEQLKLVIKKRADNKQREGTERTATDSAMDWLARSGGAGLAKLVASLITYPHEVVRTRLRQAPSDGKVKYTGLIQCFRTIIREEGLVSMYGGLTPHLMRTVPNSMIMFGTWELFTLMLSKI
ncbi:hypothetical protein CANINC_004762 [Pichia inconspicua]|uniref:Mitochondrial carrier protein RIM2 n=1 Tax=Pichia inconspicua TaxID=52247 RepID=A0A4T0WVH3_9ASCO|nr:hypothetical protein CANINC_004762 [[Candida] inconspicua]